MTPCLDRGFVRLLAHMGSDASVCAAARISYGADPASPVEDERLIRYLLRNGHTSPFEMAEIQVHVKAPIFVARQWMRHRTASINEVSARYKVLPEEVYIPDQIHGAPTNSKQGRGAVHPDSDRWRRGMEAEAASALRRYREMISAGVAPEQARIVLPVGTYTEWVWKIDLHNLLHFLALRLHPHAQQEIRVYASALALVVAELFPLTWAAFLDYKVNAVTLSAPEIRTLRAVLEGATVPPVPGHGRGEAGEWVALWSDDAPSPPWLARPALPLVSATVPSPSPDGRAVPPLPLPDPAPWGVADRLPRRGARPSALDMAGGKAAGADQGGGMMPPGSDRVAVGAGGYITQVEV